MKVALITNKHDSNWTSCKSIRSNILKSYEQSNVYKKHDFHIIKISNDLGPVESWKISRQICAESYEKLIFIEHSPHPKDILNCLAHSNMPASLSITFHVYGDFGLNAINWIECDQALKKFNCTFICSSPNQQRLLQSFMLNPDCAQFIPFSINEDVFNNNPPKKTVPYYNYLKKTPFKQEQNKGNTFLYTGRLSTQKNIIELVRYFDQAQTQFNLDDRLILAGPMDDLEVPLLGQMSKEGGFFNKFQKTINILKHQDKIFYLGVLDSQALINLYHLADYFISISTHNDEDFGMAAAEAKACGLPSILTNWGGYHLFHEIDNENNTLINVNLNDERPTPSQVQIIKAFLKCSILGAPNDKTRHLISRHYLDILSTKQVAKKIDDCFSVSIPFMGLSDLFYRYASAFELNPSAPFKGKSGNYSELYKSIYKSYIQK